MVSRMICFLLVGKFQTKKPCSVFHSLPFHRLFSSRKLAPRRANRELASALRVLDLVNPKKNGLENRRSHLRLIEDMLEINVIKPLSGDLASRKTRTEITDAVNEMIQSSVLPKGNSVFIHIEQQKEGAGIDVRFLSHTVSLCGSKRDLRGGIQYHCLSITTGFVANVYVGSSLISLYSRCAFLDDAYQAFEEMPVRNVVSWTAIIAGFAREWNMDMCLKLFQGMRNSALKPNEFTFTSLLSACSGSGALGQGRGAHCQIIEMGFYSYVDVANALITMYCKCGAIQDAVFIFENMDNKDVVTWNSMIAGYAQHGLGIEAINLFENMMKQGVNPDAITYLGVLSSCRHAGLVQEGQLYFNSMVEHGVEPELDHYSCIVDLLGRAGLLLEARDMVINMPVNPNAVIWGSLLSSSRLHGSVWIGIQAAENRLLLEPGCPATLLQLANLYASVGWWDQVARVRKVMKDNCLKINPGCSWIEVKNEVYRFGAEDKTNNRMTEMHMLMDNLIDHMRSFGLQMHEEEHVIFT
ncbi:hypothetical protein L6164_033599 [Bauhinia variegata]|uniref:Uncharacterized protein n=1 Tax=Bauhinia variegata TaxID=167791 RepID=A0ACB9KSE8_BAUVA|nr:hypothetical protein L6164_033599 [Bauhinia variegata]